MIGASIPPAGPVAALIVAAGSGRRMGFDKIIAPLAGRPVLAWSLAAFEACPDISHGIIVCAPGRLDEFRALAEPFPKFTQIVAGGAERPDSVMNGLDALAARSPSLVAVHDGARPLITPETISAVVGAAFECGAAVAAEPVSDSLHRAQGAGTLCETVSRENLWAMQTPQIAAYPALRAALSAALASRHPVTDEISVLIAAGHRPHAVAHKEPNFKITWPRDLELAAAILENRSNHFAG